MTEIEGPEKEEIDTEINIEAFQLFRLNLLNAFIHMQSTVHFFGALR